MLLNNYSVLNSSPGRAIGGFTNAFNAFKPSTLYTMYQKDLNDTVTRTQTQSIPTGTEAPYSYLIPFKGGELSATTTITGVGALSGSLLMARQLASTDLNGVGDLSGSLSLLSQLAASLAGVGDLTASMSLALALASDLAGSGDLSGSLSLLVGMLADLSGTGAITGNLTGIARLEASIYVNSGTATIEEIVAGVVDGIGSITATIPDLLNTETGDIIIPLA